MLWGFCYINTFDWYKKNIIHYIIWNLKVIFYCIISQAKNSFSFNEKQKNKFPIFYNKIPRYLERYSEKKMRKTLLYVQHLY